MKSSHPSVMKHEFSKVPNISIERSKFDRSHGYKTTFDSGYLVPVFCDEVLPGDTFNLRMAAFARLATPIKPVMDNMFMDTFFFFVPNRLLWDNWEKFNGAQDNPDDSTDYEVPQVVAPITTGVQNGELDDYFGIPTGVSLLAYNALHRRAYNLIYNTWFRDQNLQDSVVVDRDDGPDTYGDYVLLKRGKRHDYFTSALPWPQKGPDVLLPLGGIAPGVVTDASLIGLGSGATASFGYNMTAQGGSAGLTNPWFDNNDDGMVTQSISVDTSTMYVSPADIASHVGADLSNATATTINALREAEQMQVLFERDARGGTRYIEIIKSHFGVTSPDARLQRPEYLGGGSSQINIHPVPQTTASPGSPTGLDAQGNLAGFGTASFSGHGFNKSFVEHGVIIGLVNVRADLTYQQGLNRMFSRRTRYDFFWPALSHLGEQAVLNKEIFADLADGTGPTEKDGVFGYQERYAEYRYKPSMITGQFRSNFAQSLDIWHLSQEFGSQPTLSADFIVENPPIDRIIAVPSEPQFLFDSYFTYSCARPMPVYAVPTLGDRL